MDQDGYAEPLRKQVNYEDVDEARMATLAIWGLDCPIGGHCFSKP
jgi:hypothetical protein